MCTQQISALIVATLFQSANWNEKFLDKNVLPSCFALVDFGGKEKCLAYTVVRMRLISEKGSTRSNLYVAFCHY